VAAGETPAAIARKYGVTLTSLLAANPGLNPKKMRVGQTLNLPRRECPMTSRVTFCFVAAFWITMNVLLWHVEYGSRGSGVSVPVDLVWRKILTAPDASSMNIYQDGERSGFCEFSTSVEMEMAKLDGNNPPPKASSPAPAIRFT